MEEKKGIQIWHLGIIALVFFFGVLAVGLSFEKTREKSTTEVVEETPEPLIEKADPKGYTIEYGKLLNSTVNGSTLVIKAKIKPSLTNEMTINQNYYNVEHLICDQGCNSFDEIQYWAVADMSSGKESKVISFTLNKDVIDKVNNQTILPLNMGNYVDDLFIHPSLR